MAWLPLVFSASLIVWEPNGLQSSYLSESEQMKNLIPVRQPVWTNAKFENTSVPCLFCVTFPWYTFQMARICLLWFYIIRKLEYYEALKIIACGNRICTELGRLPTVEDSLEFAAWWVAGTWRFHFASTTKKIWLPSWGPLSLCHLTTSLDLQRSRG